MAHKTRSKALDEATQWFARLRDDAISSDERHAFQIWQTANLAHRRAFEEISALWDSMDGLEPDTAEMQSTTRANARAPFFKTQIAAALIIGFSALLVGLTHFELTPWSPFWGAEHFQTATGEQRTLFLDDGTTIYLNTHSKVAVRLKDKERHVRLIEGEALFDVQRDPQRPFIVDAGNGRVRVLGTRFNIRMHPDRSADVAVLEGHVDVAPRSGKEVVASIDLYRGDGTSISTDRIGPVEKVDVARITSWRDGRMIFRGTPLSTVVADLNRYLTDDVRIGDDSLQDITVTAVIRIEDRAAILRALDMSLPVDVVTLPSGVTMLYDDRIDQGARTTQKNGPSKKL
ncbi:iron dicitrate transporter FecR [Iodidimonas muriae]|uniref:Iron dicitrate transporter FecR n=1 Tax=Iodidimonas muriae TaxID=261467 RepID=A0ABQ2LF75_9PROT|nr:FecR family protein [Iodidimonas muriae]GER08515.1 iron dicitrate transporter FecR [Kordiimonadales bacterium JCM 17843]GGO15259.1 iron dicitrate transporter FecR [Iodidimonas muriae]